MPDEIIDSLRKAFIKDKEDGKDDCPMADKVTAYAFGEIAIDDTDKVKEHILTCRHCLNLVMDIKIAEEEAEKVKNEKIAVLPGLQSAIDKGKISKPIVIDKVRESVAEYISKGIDFFTFDIVLHGRLQMGFRGGQPEFKELEVKPGGAINSGDYFRFEAMIDKDAFVYVVFQDSLGKIESSEKGYLEGKKRFFLPGGNQWFQLDDNTGTEKLFLLAAENEIEGFSKKVEDLERGGIDAIEKVFIGATIQTFSFEHR